MRTAGMSGLVRRMRKSISVRHVVAAIDKMAIKSALPEIRRQELNWKTELV